MSVEILLTIVEKGVSLYDAYESAAVIDEIWRTLRDIYGDIAAAHFASAKSAMESARHSRNPSQEVRVANGHLRDAYHLYQSLLTKTRTEGLFRKRNVPVLSYAERQTVEATLLEIATFLALNYHDLEEPKNAKQWKSNAVQYLDSFVAARTSHLTLEYLRDRVNKKFVTRAYSEGSPGSAGSPMSPGYTPATSSSWSEVISDEGKKYLEQQREALRKAVLKIFKQRQIG